MQTQCRLEQDKQIQAELGEKILSRDQVLSIFEQLQRLQRQIQTEFEKDQPKDADGQVTKLSEEKEAETIFELEYKHAVAEAQFFDQMFMDKQIEERAYFFSLKKMDIQNDPKFKAVFAQYSEKEE